MFGEGKGKALIADYQAKLASGEIKKSSRGTHIFAFKRNGKGRHFHAGPFFPTRQDCFNQD